MKKSLLAGVTLCLFLDGVVSAQTPSLTQAVDAVTSVFSSTPSAAWVAHAKAMIAGDAALQSQRVGKLAVSVVHGNMDAAPLLDTSQQQLARDLELLSTGGLYRGRPIPGATASEQAMLANAKHVWANSARATALILERKSNVANFYATLAKLKPMTPALLEASEQLVALYIMNSGAPREISDAGLLAMICIRLDRSASTFFVSEGIDPETAFLLGKDTNNFRIITDGLLNGNATLRLSAAKNKDIRDKLTALHTSFKDYEIGVKSILDDLKIFIELKQAVLVITTENENVKIRLLDMQETFQRTFDASA